MHHLHFSIKRKIFVFVKINFEIVKSPLLLRQIQLFLQNYEDQIVLSEENLV